MFLQGRSIDDRSVQVPTGRGTDPQVRVVVETHQDIKRSGRISRHFLEYELVGLEGQPFEDIGRSGRLSRYDQLHHRYGPTVDRLGRLARQAPEHFWGYIVPPGDGQAHLPFRVIGSRFDDPDRGALVQDGGFAECSVRVAGQAAQDLRVSHVHA